jgi:hypothetical protein
MRLTPAKVTQVTGSERLLIGMKDKRIQAPAKF